MYPYRPNTPCYPIYYSYVPMCPHPYSYIMAPTYPPMNWHSYSSQQTDDTIWLYGEENDPEGRHPVGFPITLFDVSEVLQHMVSDTQSPLPSSPIPVEATTQDLQRFQQYFDLTQIKTLELDEKLEEISRTQGIEIIHSIEKIADYLEIPVLKRAIYYLRNRYTLQSKTAALENLIRGELQKDSTQTVLSILEKEYPASKKGVQEAKVIAERIKVLHLHNLGITKLSDQIFQGLTHLQEIALNHNQLTSLPGTLFHGLTHLKSLDLSFNQLDNLPETSFHTLTALQKLYLNHNQLASLPETLFHGLTRLENLELYHNKLNTLPKTLFQGLTRLKNLALSFNQLDDLPETLFHTLTALQKLYLNDNQLASLPETLFRSLIKLEKLYLHNNQLSDLPKTLFQNLVYLKSLDISNNQLTKLPRTLFQGLIQLEWLSLSHNHLTQTKKQFQATHPLPLSITTFNYNPQLPQQSN